MQGGVPLSVSMSIANEPVALFSSAKRSILWSKTGDLLQILHGMAWGGMVPAVGNTDCMKRQPLIR